MASPSYLCAHFTHGIAMHFASQHVGSSCLQMSRVRRKASCSNTKWICPDITKATLSIIGYSASATLCQILAPPMAHYAHLVV